MRLYALILSLILIAPSCFPADKTAVTEENVKMFLELYPKFKEITENKPGSENDQNETQQMTLAKMYEFQDEFNSLFADYGITVEEFAQLMQKISIGYACAQMQSQGQDTYGISIPEEDMKVIKQYQAEIEKVLDVK